jgi:hypothetical protein
VHVRVDDRRLRRNCRGGHGGQEKIATREAHGG